MMMKNRIGLLVLSTAFKIASANPAVSSGYYPESLGEYQDSLNDQLEESTSSEDRKKTKVTLREVRDKKRVIARFASKLDIIADKNDKSVDRMGDVMEKLKLKIEDSIVNSEKRQDAIKVKMAPHAENLHKAVDGWKEEQGIEDEDDTGVMRSGYHADVSQMTDAEFLQYVKETYDLEEYLGMSHQDVVDHVQEKIRENLKAADRVENHIFSNIKDMPEEEFGAMLNEHFGVDIQTAMDMGVDGFTSHINNNGGASKLAAIQDDLNQT